MPFVASFTTAPGRLHLPISPSPSSSVVARLLPRRPRRGATVSPLQGSSSYSSEMEASVGTALYPLHRCKTIYLVRHAQGIHNVEGEKDHSAYMSPALLDAHLTPWGWNQDWMVAYIPLSCVVLMVSSTSMIK